MNHACVNNDTQKELIKNGFPLVQESDKERLISLNQLFEQLPVTFELSDKEHEQFGQNNPEKNPYILSFERNKYGSFIVAYYFYQGYERHMLKVGWGTHERLADAVADYWLKLRSCRLI